LGISSLIAWGAFFVYRPDKGGFSGEGVSVVIDGPDSLESGQKATYVVSVHNNGGVALGSAGIHLRIPEQFHVSSDSADSDDVTETGDILIGAIPPRETKTYTISGTFITSANKTHDIQTVLTYHPTDFNSEFQAVATKSIAITGSVLNIAATGPKKTVAGEPVSVELVIANPSEQAINNLVVTAEYPKEFTPDKSTPTASNSDISRWTIASIAAGKEAKIRVTGSFISAAKGPYTLPFTLSLDATNGLLFQEKAEVAVEVNEGDLLVALVANGRTESQAVGFGDVLRYSISYRNIGDSVLEDASIVLHLDSTPTDVEVLSWNDLVDKERGVRKGNTLTWTKKQVLSLGKIGPKSEGVVEITIPVTQTPEKSSGNGTTYVVNAFAEANVAVIDGQKVKRTAKSQPLSVFVRSDARFSAIARYYNDAGEALGSGPLPPKQGVATTYHVDFSITNSLHELHDLVLTATLPEGAVVSGTPRADAGVVNYDAKTRKLTWTLNWMPISVSLLNIGVDIAFTPTKAMVGKIPPILENISLVAKDKTLEASLSQFTLTSPTLTTSLLEDEKGSGKGKVE
jgi:hypothetical protein